MCKADRLLKQVILFVYHIFACDVIFEILEPKVMQHYSQNDQKPQKTFKYSYFLTLKAALPSI